MKYLIKKRTKGVVLSARKEINCAAGHFVPTNSLAVRSWIPDVNPSVASSVCQHYVCLVERRDACFSVYLTTFCELHIALNEGVDVNEELSRVGNEVALAYLQISKLFLR